MSKTHRIIIFLCLISTIQKVYAQTLEFRPSLGWGIGWARDYKILTNDPNSGIIVEFDKHKVPNAQNPQLGLMIDFNIDNKFIVSIGRTLGKTEFKSNGNGGGCGKSAIIQKYGGDFLVSVLDYKNKYKLYVLAGAYYVNNRNTDYNAGKMVLDTYRSDSLYSRISDTSFNIKPSGAMLNFGIRVAFMNKQKARERFSLTLLYDYGLKDLVTTQSMWQYDYMTKYTHAQSTSRGSQVKLYFSMPFIIYDFKKDKYKLLKK
ncbi:MAG: hypothetical protein IT215_00080 [Chitinophagaceae bacterium]|nr:hypothetical protein [Chitinophagaceae bacterium]